jgi:hypothetical protein
MWRTVERALERRAPRGRSAGIAAAQGAGQEVIMSHNASRRFAAFIRSLIKAAAVALAASGCASLPRSEDFGPCKPCMVAAQGSVAWTARPTAPPDAPESAPADDTHLSRVGLGVSIVRAGR